MKFGNLQSGAGRLQEAAETLNVKWQQTRDVWQDANAARFEEEELEKLGQAIQIALPAIAQMSTAMHALQRELTDERHRGEGYL